MSIKELNESLYDIPSKKTLSLYVHIPFCASKCAYCSFVSVVGNPQDKKRYFSDLLAELSYESKLYKNEYVVSSIYIGGGTPSCLDHYYIRDLLSSIYKNFSVRNAAEVTIEVNPNSCDKSKIREYILSGINRFSIGLQSTNPKILKAMGRTHTVKDYDNMVNYIKSYGISNISTDVIIGYPKQKLSDVKDTIAYLIGKRIPHISVYMLSVENGTKLKQLVEGGAAGLPEEDEVIEMYNAIYNMLSEAGYKRYEFSNFAKPGYESYHNKNYWSRKDYLGLGLASHSYISGTRFSITESITTYAKTLEQKKELPIATSHALTEEEKKEEAVMLSLRTARGLDLEDYKDEFKENFLAKKKDTLTKLITNGFLILTPDNRLVCTDKGFLVLNRIVLMLIG